MFCKIFKLSSGDTVIGNVVEESENYIEVHRPMRVVLVSRISDDYAFNLSMMKWDPLMNFTLPSRIFKHSIVSVSEATDDVLKVYAGLYNQFEVGEHEENTVMQNNINEEFDSEEIKGIRSLDSVSANTHTIH